MSKGSGSSRNPYRSANPQQVITVAGNGKRMRTSSIISSEGSISTMNNRDMQKELQQAISRYEAVLGVRQRKVMLADLKGAFGATTMNGDGSLAVYVDRGFFDRPKDEVEKDYVNQNYRRRGGFKNTTRKPAQHTLTHELAHATWSSNYRNPKHQAAGKEINEVYKTFMKDKSSSRKKNYGSYGTENADEFFAEVVTKAIHGDNDNYTRKIKAIVKKYNL